MFDDIPTALAKKAGYMILTEDTGYLPFWIKPNGDVVKPAEQEQETKLLVDSLVSDLSEEDRTYVLGVSGFAQAAELLQRLP